MTLANNELAVHVLRYEARGFRALATTVKHLGDWSLTSVQSIMHEDVPPPGVRLRETALPVKQAVSIAVRALRVAADWCEQEAKRETKSTATKPIRRPT